MKDQFTAVFLCLFVFLVPAQSAQIETVDVPALVKAATKNGRESKLMTEYTYAWRWEQVTEKNGERKQRSFTFETYVPTLKNKGKTDWVLAKTKENDQPLLPEKLEKERQRAGERLVKAEEEARRVNRDQPSDALSAGAIGVYFAFTVNQISGGDLKLNVATILRTSDFSSPRREFVRGRAAIALDFRPKPGAKFDREEAFLGQCRGTIWIDEQEKVVARAEGWSSPSTVQAKQPAFSYNEIRLSDGVWLPDSIQIYGLAHRELFSKLPANFRSDFTDYKRFVSEVKDVKLQDPPNKN